jgi:pantoate--beta-alanine ligase
MILLTKNDDLKAYRRSLKGNVGFVPTMGGIHDGHLSLVKQALAQTDHVIVSIFVNPAQFAPHEDFNSYPRPFEKDQALMKSAGASAIFCPTPEMIYPNGKANGTQVYVPKISKKLCGISRPHFFQGVCTVVARLFNLVEPNKAFFGEKDFQQLQIIKQMTRDLFMDIDVVGCPIVRESDGLAMSSRNIYLSPAERHEATQIFQGFNHVLSLFKQGKTNTSFLTDQLKAYLESTSSFRIDYAEILNPITFKKSKITVSKDRLFFAGFLGKTRLIDNIALE